MPKESYSIEFINENKSPKCILTAIRYKDIFINGEKRKMVYALCGCGEYTLTRSHCIINGNTTSCGCRNRLSPPNAHELTGRKFGKLTVLGASKEKKQKWKTFWYCQCECGKIKTIVTASLTNGFTKSCGCLVVETNNLNKPGFKHGMSFTPTHNCWHSMKQRCYYKKHIGYKYYGGRGITVCDRWLNSFQNFFEDMGFKPENLSLDRIDSNKVYSKENCRWATDKQQQSENKRGLHMVFINGENLTLTDAVSKYSSVCYENVLRRIRFYKWDSVRAITTPNIQGKGKKLNKIHSKWLS